MKKIYDKHFRVLENEKIKEHVMKMRILFVITVICISMMSMGITAYAFFSCTVSSSNNVIKSAHFKLDKTWDEASKQYVTKDSDGWYKLENVNAHTSFVLTMKRSVNTTAQSGFAKIEIQADDYEGPSAYFTKSIKPDENSTYEITFVVPKGETVKIRVIDNWGTCADTTIIENKSSISVPYEPTNTTDDSQGDESKVDESQVDESQTDEQEPENDEPVSGEDSQDTPSDGVTGEPEEGAPEVNPEQEPEEEPGTDTEGGTPEETPEETVTEITE